MLGFAVIMALSGLGNGIAQEDTEEVRSVETVEFEASAVQETQESNNPEA